MRLSRLAWPLALLGALPALLSAEESLELRIRKALARNDRAEAERLLAEASAKSPGEPRPALELARVRASSGNASGALEALQLAARRGFGDRAELVQDAALDPVRSLPGYRDLLEFVKANGAAALARFAQTAAENARALYFPAPPSFTGPRPLIVALHFSGGTAERFAPLFRGVAQEAGVVLAVPEGLEPFWNGFDWGVQEQGHHLILRAIDEASRRFQVDPKRIVLAGYSGGATAALSSSLSQPERFAGVIAIAGRYRDRVTPVPVSASRLPRYVLMVADRDLNAEGNRKLARALQAASAEVELRVFPGLGHSLPEAVDVELRTALRFVLGGRGSQ